MGIMRTFFGKLAATTIAFMCAWCALPIAPACATDAQGGGETSVYVIDEDDPSTMEGSAGEDKPSTMGGDAGKGAGGTAANTTIDAVVNARTDRSTLPKTGDALPPLHIAAAGAGAAAASAAAAVAARAALRRRDSHRRKGDIR